MVFNVDITSLRQKFYKYCDKLKLRMHDNRILPFIYTLEKLSDDEVKDVYLKAFSLKHKFGYSDYEMENFRQTFKSLSIYQDIKKQIYGGTYDNTVEK